MVESERQLAPMAKQPEVILNPTSEVEVALPEMLRPESVVVPKPVAATERNFVACEVDATSKSGLVCVVLVAWMAKVAKGVVVPRPKFPVEESNMNCDFPAFPKRTVEDAWRPFVRRSVEEGAEVRRPKLSVGVKGNAEPEPVASVPQESTPFVDFTSQAAAPRAETVRLVVEAVVAEIIVVDAKGNCEAAAVDDAKKTPWVRMEVVVAAVEGPNGVRVVEGEAKFDEALTAT